MRRALAAAVIAVMTATACGTQPGIAANPLSRTTTASPTAADPAVTRQACLTAVRAAGDGVRVFNDQLQVLERAAARGDQHAMVAAAEVINNKMRELASTLRRLSQTAVSPRVRAALGGASAMLRDITSVSYTGSPSDIRTALVGFGTSFHRACR
jgi:hypothetical protein